MPVGGLRGQHAPREIAGAPTTGPRHSLCARPEGSPGRMRGPLERCCEPGHSRDRRVRARALLVIHAARALSARAPRAALGPLGWCATTCKLLRARVSFCVLRGGPGVFFAAASGPRAPGSALSKAKAGVVASGTASSAAVIARREKDLSCMLGALVRIV
eukprot:scaffold24704_cov58-Phaeocystis_antarctica.AAC.5